MRMTFKLSLAAVLFLASSFSSNLLFAHETRPVRSLNDLPAHWEGVAGNLVTRVTTTLSIDKIRKVSREEGPHGFTARYDVDGSITFGERRVTLSKVELSADCQSGVTAYTLLLMTNDPLTPNLWAGVFYDEVSDTFTIKEYTRAGAERRFILSAKAG